MNKKQVMHKIPQIRWYKQGVHTKLRFILVGSIGAHAGWKPELVFNCISNSTQMEAYYPEHELDNKAKDLIESSKAESAKIDEILDNCKKAWKNLDEFFPKINAESAEEIKQMLDQLHKLNCNMWKYTFVSDFFDPHGEELLHDQIDHIKFETNEIATMLRPNELSYSQKQRLELIKAVKSDNGQIIAKQSEQYFYIDNSWESTRVLEKKDFKKKFDELQSDLAEADEQIKDLETDWKAEQDKIIRKYEISQEIVNIFYMYRIIFYIRDQRKKYVQLCNHYYDVLFEKLEKILELDSSLLHTPDLIDFDRERLMDLIEKRKNNLTAIFYDNEWKIFSGEDSKEMLVELHKTEKHFGDEVKGRCACEGKVKGIIRVIMGETHFGKFNEGEILVAPMTRPEYVPLMKKAAAIVTDEGGITSHAAVISRELGVPCVIGTKVATKVLKDNDEVEVDATNGKVKIL